MCQILCSVVHADCAKSIMVIINHRMYTKSLLPFAHRFCAIDIQWITNYWIVRAYWTFSTPACRFMFQAVPTSSPSYHLSINNLTSMKTDTTTANILLLSYSSVSFIKFNNNLLRCRFPSRVLGAGHWASLETSSFLARSILHTYKIRGAGPAGWEAAEGRFVFTCLVKIGRERCYFKRGGKSWKVS